MLKSGQMLILTKTFLKRTLSKMKINDNTVNIVKKL